MEFTMSSKQKQLREVPRSNQGLRRAKIEAYVQHIYHTNAMEGNTMTLMQTRAVVETGVAIGGKSIYEHNEILGMDAALQYINKTLLHQAQSINIRDILEIHKRVLGFVNIEEAGRFRHTQVTASRYRYCDKLEQIVTCHQELS
jgi:Fic family protein